MPIEFLPISLPPSADASKLSEFGREVRGFDPGKDWTEDEFREIEEGLYKYDLLLFRNCEFPPEKQLALTRAFDPTQASYGHDHDSASAARSIILHPGVKHIPHVPQVQLIGNGHIPPEYTYGLSDGGEEVRISHPTHTTFHRTQIGEDELWGGDGGRGGDDESGDKRERTTRFMRWHIDAALYDLSPPKVTTLYGVVVPGSESPGTTHQTCRYDDGTSDTLDVPTASTVFISGKNMFEGLEREWRSVAVRGRVRYAPYPYVWMSTARAHETGLGIVCEGREVPLEELPEWKEERVKVLPFLWKNPITGELAMQVHACAALELIIDPLPADAPRDGALYPDGAHIKNLKAVRELLYEMQRPAIAPSLIYPHDWRPKDLVLFHNRGVMHSVTGTLRPDELRVFHQCNLAASEDPEGPSADDVRRWA